MVALPKLEESWLSFLLLLLLIQSAVMSVVVASWVDGLGILPWVAVIAILLGLAFAKLRVPGILLHLLALAVGSGVVAYLVCYTLPEGTIEDRFNELVTRLLNWISVISTGGIGNDNLLFLLLLASITWLMGYFGAWTVFHSHSGWLVSVTAGAALVINISYAPNLMSFFLVFLVCAILLVVRLNFFKQESSWRSAGVDYGGDLGWILVRSSFLITGVVIVISWLTPSTILASQPVSEAFVQMSRPWDDVQGEFNRLFGGIKPKGQPISSNFGKTLPLKTGVKLGGEVVLLVSGTEPRRLRGVVYEKYTGQGWLAAERPAYRIPADSERPGLAPEYKLRQDITQTITVVEPRGTVLFAPSVPKRISVPTTAEMELRPSVVVDERLLEGDQAESSDLQFVARELEDIIAREKLSYRAGDGDAEVPQAMVSAISQQLTSNFELLGMRMRNEQITSAVVRPIDMDYADVSVVRNPSMSRKGFRYTVVSSVSIADAESLRKAGGGYPDWVRSRYLALPRTVTWRTISLARQITSRYDNRYDAAVAIETYLRTLSYSDQVNLPASARDAVDYFLFQGKEGYCDYFASAFAVLARARGIPTRVVSGFAPGDPDPVQGVTVVRDWHAHSWPEAYFPEYGWIEFEPTPSRPIIARPETSPPQTVDSAGGTGAGDEGPKDQLEMDDLAAEAPGGTPLSIGLSDSHSARDVLINLFKALGAIASLGIVAYGILLYLWRRGVSGLPPGEAAYAKMCRLGHWLGIRKGKHQTPNEYGAVLSAIAPDQERNIRLIVEAYVRQVFGRKRSSCLEERQLVEAWRQVRNRLLRVRLNRRWV